MREKQADGTPDDVSGAPSARFTPAMRRTMLVVAVVVLAGAAVSLWLAFGGGGAADRPAGAVTSSAPSTPGPLPGATPAEGSEVQSPAPQQSNPARLPPLPVATPRVVSPLPPSASADGRLVEGFPESLMGPAADSDIISSSIATEGDVMQVTLVARTDASKESVLQAYRTSWADQGLNLPASVDGATELSAADSFTTITLSFTTESGTGTVYALYGVLRAG